MGWILIIGALFLVSLIAAIVCDYHCLDVVAGISLLFAVLTFVALLCMGGSLINKEARFDTFVRDYEATKALVENYRGTDYGNMQALTEKVISLNGRIAEHKAFVGNKLSGIWYSEKIASLDPITFTYPDTKNLE